MSRGSRVLSSAMLTALLASPALAGDVMVQPSAGDGFVVKNNTGAIERLRVDEATGNVSKDGTLFLHTTGASSVFVGADAGAANATCCNAAFGYHALNANSSGYANSAFGFEALRSTLGLNNSAFGASALANNTTGASNSAFGSGALFGDVAAPDKSGNSAFGYNALYVNQADGNSAFGANALAANTTGYGNAAFGYQTLQSNNVGLQNSAFGYQALQNNTDNRNSAFGYRALAVKIGGVDNSAFGNQALEVNEGGNNSAFGSQTLSSNTTGTYNSAFGYHALLDNTSGGGNSAFGYDALSNLTAGIWNTALGSRALGGFQTGDDNIAIGYYSGYGLDYGSDNIYIGSDTGAATESATIRIGDSEQTQTFIEGIYGATSASGIPVYINSSNQLGTLTSSIRFKQAVRDMEDASLVLAKLRPVTFQYREEIAGGEDLLQYGLIAEEVAELEPGLVAYDEAGEPYSVRYQFLAPMLVNEYQKQQRTVDEQAARIARQESAIEQLTARLELLEAEAGRAVR